MKSVLSFCSALICTVQLLAGSWTEISSTLPSPPDARVKVFGWSDSSNSYISYANSSGHAPVVYKYTGTSWTEISSTLSSPPAADYEVFGWSDSSNSYISYANSSGYAPVVYKYDASSGAIGSVQGRAWKHRSLCKTDLHCLITWMIDASLFTPSEFVIYRDGAPLQTLTDGDARSAEDPHRKASTVYTYEVVAINSDEERESVGSVSLKTPKP